MASKSHKSVEFVNFRVVDSPINAVNPFKYKRDAHQFGIFWCALENFTLYDSQIASFDRKHKRMVDYYFVY